MKPFSSHTRSCQRGIVSVLAAIILIAAVIFVLSQTLGIIGTTGNANKSQGDSIAAFFLAESGIEQAKSVLASGVPTASSTCTGLGASTNLGRGTFSTSGLPGPTGCVDDCTSCKVTSTGTVESASRTIEVVMSVSAPSGGATGCGGGGITPVNCPSGVSPAPPAGDKYPDILQSIEVTTPPAILVSNMAYLRHPAGGANNVNAAAACVQNTPADLGCLTQWHDESNTSAGAGVVGSRGASAVITTAMDAGTYKLTQNLDADSLFAAVGAKFGGSNTLGIVGSFWSDSGATGVTARNNSTASGSTNNGAACVIDAGTVTCPAPTLAPLSIPNPPSSGSNQTSRSWCYDADTLVFGFSGRSATGNSGTLTAFAFNDIPSSVPLGSSVAQYPKPAGSTNSELYSAIRYIYNPAYLSPDNSNTRTGALVTGYAGTSLVANLSKNQSYLEATTVTGAALASGLTLTFPTEGFVATTNTACKTASNLTTDCATPGGAGFYGISNKHNNDATNVAGSAPGSVLHVTNASLAYLADGDTIFHNGVNTGVTVTFVSGTLGGVGTYSLSAPRFISSSSDNITSNGIKVTTKASDATPPQVPVINTIIARRWTPVGAGQFSPSPITVATLPITSSDGTTTTTTYDLSTRTVEPLSGGAQICGGICAFFNHASDSASTPFTIGITGTSQWAAGMTCLKGVNKDDIVGLTGTLKRVSIVNWHEQVR